MSKTLRILLDGDLRQVLTSTAALRIAAEKYYVKHGAESFLYVVSQEHKLLLGGMAEFANVSKLAAADVYHDPKNPNLGLKLDWQSLVADGEPSLVVNVNHNAAMQKAMESDISLQTAYAEYLGVHDKRIDEMPTGVGFDKSHGTGTYLSLLAADRGQPGTTKLETYRNRGVACVISDYDLMNQAMVLKFVHKLIHDEVPVTLIRSREHSEPVSMALESKCLIANHRSIVAVCEALLTCRFHVTVESQSSSGFSQLALALGAPTLVVYCDTLPSKLYKNSGHMLQYVDMNLSANWPDALYVGVAQVRNYFDCFD